jgi:hypothetical protein
MSTNRIQQYIEEAKQRLNRDAAETINERLEWALQDSEQVCETEIEKLFFMVWVEILERYRIQGWYRSWMSQYHVRGSSTGGCPPFEIFIKEKPFHSLILSGADQIDLIYPQQAIGKYRADFILIRLRFGYTGKAGFEKRTCDTLARVVIECDGHDFHEKTKEQAKRDKERDRLMQTEGYYVLRFTGSELF